MLYISIIYEVPSTDSVINPCVSAGIRVSSFVSADDKKPLQKSIVGFLQQGRADSSSPTQISSHKPVKEHQPKPPGQTQPFPCPSLVQQSQGQEDHPWVPSWGGGEDWGAAAVLLPESLRPEAAAAS